MKYQYLTFLLLTFFLSASFDSILYGQKYKNNKLETRPYEDGPLTWQDFTIKEYKTQSSLYWFISSDEKKTNYKGNNTLYKSTIANVNKNLSVIYKDDKSDTLLQHFQNIFDLVHSYAKDAEYHFRHDAQSTLFYDQEISEIYANMHAELKAYIEDSKNGADAFVVYEFKKIISDRVKNASSINNILGFRTTPHSLSIYMSAGYFITSGRMHQYIPNQMSLNIGFGYGYKNLIARFNMNILSKDLVNDFTLGNNFYNKNQSYTSIIPTGSLGYLWSVNKRMNFTPSLRLGGYVSQLFPKDVEDAKAFFSDNQFLYGLGLDLDYLFFKRIKLTKKYLDPRANENLSLGLMLTYDKIGASNALNGNVFGVSLSFGLSSRIIK